MMQLVPRDQHAPFLAEVTKDPRGATRTLGYGAVTSAESLIGFLGRKALGIGANAVAAVEQHISKAVATALIAALSGAAITISGAVPAGWAWPKPLLEALTRGGRGGDGISPTTACGDFRRGGSRPPPAPAIPRGSGPRPPIGCCSAGRDASTPGWWHRRV